jgi:hypothetical protein
MQAEGTEPPGEGGPTPGEGNLKTDAGEPKPEQSDSKAEDPKPGKAERALAERRGNYPWAPIVTEKFPQCADSMYHAVHTQTRRYRRYGRAHMSWFRLTGLVEIVLSVSFPFVVALFDQKAASAPAGP